MFWLPIATSKKNKINQIRFNLERLIIYYTMFKTCLLKRKYVHSPTENHTEVRGSKKFSLNQLHITTAHLIFLTRLSSYNTPQSCCPVAIAARKRSFSYHKWSCFLVALHEFSTEPLKSAGPENNKIYCFPITRKPDHFNP